MVLEQTITIVNNSGKIVKTGKNLFSIFKEAQGSYKEKKAELKSQKTLKRSQTFDPSRSAPRAPSRHDFVEDDFQFDPPPRRSYEVSDAGSRHSRRSRSVHSRRTCRDRGFDTRSQALTEGNLKTLSEVSATAPTKIVPRGYVNPYAETVPMEMAMSRRDLGRSVAPTRGPGTIVPRNKSTGELVLKKTRKSIDMDLAYGDIPPDLATRTDLDPVYEEKEASALVSRVEGLLTEAKCVHHSASATISHLQKDPDAAAAVALTLAELSSLVKKTSPAFLGLLKSGSPAVFSLLASPHFLIGSSVVLGVTVVCFGGWKIVKRVKEAQAAREALAYEGVPMNRPAPLRTQSEYSAGVDEALIVDDDISSIDTWRRGIVPYGEDESVDMELITPEANRSRLGDDFDTRSRRSTRTAKTSKTSKTSKTHESHRSSRSHKTEASHKSSRSRRDDRDDDRRSRHGDRDDDRRSRRDTDSIAESLADSERSHRSSRSKRSERVETRSIDDGRSRRSDSELVLRPKANHSNNMLKALFKSKDKREREMVLA